ncbi:restriction endonuclease [Paenibacillus sp. SN-8-1]|uniref:restriction endonuclease n=1 Tax=Paenibacillus sp. SN-8-1 TaxID=3435409 RepID=UPI003D9A55FA
MARRKSKAKQQEEFLQAVLGASFVFPSLLTYMVTSSLQIAGIVGGVCVVASICFMIHIANLKRERLKRSGIAEIDKMDGIQFEKYLGHLFRSQGYKAEVTQAAGDYGADLVLTKDSKRIVVQAKRYSKNVGLKAVQEVQGAIAHYRASSGWVVTNSDYTAQAFKLAKSNGVRLINRDELIEMLLQMKDKLSGAKSAATAEKKTSA